MQAILDTYQQKGFLGTRVDHYSDGQISGLVIACSYWETIHEENNKIRQERKMQIRNNSYFRSFSFSPLDATTQKRSLPVSFSVFHVFFCPLPVTNGNDPIKTLE